RGGIGQRRFAETETRQPAAVASQQHFTGAVFAAFWYHDSFGRQPATATQAQVAPIAQPHVPATSTNLLAFIHGQLATLPRLPGVAQHGPGQWMLATLGRP